MPTFTEILESQPEVDVIESIARMGAVDGDHLAEEAIHYQFAKHRVRRFDLTEMFVLSAIEQDVMSMIMRNSAVLETRQ